MPIISSTAQSVAVNSRISVSFDSDTYWYTRSSNTGSGSVTCSVSIPAGSTVHSSTFTCKTSGATLYGGTTKINGTTVSGSGPHTVANGTATSITVNFSFKSSYDPSDYTGNPKSTTTTTRTFSDCILTVNYSLPYTAPTVTDVKLNSGTADVYVTSGTASLSWTGTNGNQNAISSYTIQRSINGGAWTNLKTGQTASPLSVTASATPGDNYRYQVIPLAPHGNGAAAASPRLYTYSNPSVSSVKLAASTSAQYRAASSVVSLSWTGTNGANNAIASYTIQSSTNGGAWTSIKTGQASSPYNVTASATAGTNIKYRVMAVGAHSSSSYVESPLLHTYSPPGTPSGLTLTPASTFPGVSVTLKWTASSAGVGVSITKYEVYRGGVLIASPTTNSTTFSAPSAGSYVYTVKAIGSVSGYNSGTSSGKTLTVVNPASNFTLNRTTVPMDNATTITATITPAATGLTHKVKWFLDGTYTFENTKATGVNTDTVTLPLNWNNKYPSASSGTASCTVTTLNGGVVTGTATKTFSVTVPSTAIPTVTIATAAVDGFGSYYLRNKSKCKVTGSFTGSYGSTLVEWTVSGGGYSGTTSPWTTGLLSTLGTNTMYITAKDSRGRLSTTATKNITVTDYSAPLISSTTAYRCNSGGTAANLGTYIRTKGTATPTALTGNAITSFTAKYRQSGGSWSAATSLTNNTLKTIGGGAINIAYSYEVLLTATDTVGTSSSSTMYVPPAVFLYEFLNDRAGIGKLAGNAKTLTLPDDWTTNIKADSATKLTTARTLTIGNTGKTFNGTGNVSWSLAEIGAAASGHNHNGTYASVAANNTYAFLGATYVSGGNEKPNYFGSGKLKLQMLSGSNLGAGVSWNDVLWMSSYTGTDVKPSNALILGKSSDYIGFVRQNYDATAWGTVRTILHSGNYTSYCTPANIGAAAASHSHNYAAASHNHSAANITSGTLTVARGGTGATTAAAARTNLGITLANLGAAASSHSHSYLPLAGGTLTGNVVAHAATNYTTFRVRNIACGTAAASGGSNGYVYIKYS